MTEKEKSCPRDEGRGAVVKPTPNIEFDFRLLNPLFSFGKIPEELVYKAMSEAHVPTVDRRTIIGKFLCRWDFVRTTIGGVPFIVQRQKVRKSKKMENEARKYVISLLEREDGGKSGDWILSTTLRERPVLLIHVREYLAHVKKNRGLKIISFSLRGERFYKIRRGSWTQRYKFLRDSREVP